MSSAPRHPSRRLSLRVVALLAVVLAVGPPPVAAPNAGFSGRGMILASEDTLIGRGVTSDGGGIERHVSDLAGSSMRWPTTGRLTQRYGCTGFTANQRVGSCRNFHTGIDIANAKWTTIRAARSGVVAFVGREPWGAWMVVLRHGNGLRTQYAHMVPTRVQGISRGRAVRQGQIIGYMGESGMATGVHLHFEVKRDGRFVDPLRYLPDR